MRQYHASTFNLNSAAKIPQCYTFISAVKGILSLCWLPTLSCIFTEIRGEISHSHPPPPPKLPLYPLSARQRSAHPKHKLLIEGPTDIFSIYAHLIRGPNLTGRIFPFSKGGVLSWGGVLCSLSAILCNTQHILYYTIQTRTLLTQPAFSTTLRGLLTEGVHPHLTYVYEYILDISDDKFSRSQTDTTQRHILKPHKGSKMESTQHMLTPTPYPNPPPHPYTPKNPAQTYLCNFSFFYVPSSRHLT